MANVVVTGVDGSETAKSAAHTAATLAYALDAELLVVCVYNKLEIEQVEADGREYVFTTQESALELAEQTIQSLRSTLADLKAKPVATQGRPAEGLLRAAQDNDARLIVVGNRRVQGVARILGSIATDIAHKAPCDVYIAHTHARD